MKNAAKLFFWTFLIVAGVLLLMVIADAIRPYKPPQAEVDPAFKIYPETHDEWGETANSLGVHRDSLTILQYLAHVSQPGPSKEELDAKLIEYMKNR